MRDSTKTAEGKLVFAGTHGSTAYVTLEKLPQTLNDKIEIGSPEENMYKTLHAGLQKSSSAGDASHGLRLRQFRALGLLLMVAALAPLRAVAQTPPGMPLIAHNASEAPMLARPLILIPGQIPSTIPQNDTFRDPTGQISSYQPGGSTTTSSNAFFLTNTATNGRTCFTCHQPQNAWSITPSTIITEFLQSAGRNVLFQPIDSANCPNTPGATSSIFFTALRARSQFFNHGNFRMSITAPNPLGGGTKTFNGSTPQWVMTVKSDPTGCELDPTYGLPNNLVGLYRRPLATANQLLDNPGTGGPLTAPSDMWDLRQSDLRQLFIDATEFHGQTTVPPTAEERTEGTLFQQGIFTAQSSDNLAGDLTGGDGSGALGGPVNLYGSRLDSGIDGNSALGIDGEQFITGANSLVGGCAITGTTYASLSDVPGWAPGTYSKTALVLDSNGNLEVALTGGTTGNTEPSPWPLTIASTTPDGSVVWQLVEVGDVCPAIKSKEFIAAGVKVNNGFELYTQQNPGVGNLPGPATFNATAETGPIAIAQRESIQRGEVIFHTKQFTIGSADGFGGAAGTLKTCTTCHNNVNAGNNGALAPLNTGVGKTTIGVPACTPALIAAGTPCTTLPPTPDFPLFAFYCPSGVLNFPSVKSVASPNCALLPGSPATCDEFDTNDPGAGLITGQCTALGAMKAPVLRGLAARAPYFHGGQAATLQALVSFYNARFNIGLSAQDRQDLVNFLNAL